MLEILLMAQTCWVCLPLFPDPAPAPPACPAQITDLNACPNRVGNGVPPSTNGCTAVPDNPNLVPDIWVPVLAQMQNIPFTGAPSFKPACDNHDFCYSTCNPANMRDIQQGKAVCDNNFRIDLENICGSVTVTSRPIIYGQCNFFKDVYVGAVRNMPAVVFYEPGQKRVCRCCP